MPTYDLFSPTFKADPFPTYAEMREHDPIYAHITPNGERIWFITRYEDVVAVLKDNDHFCKDFRHTQERIPNETPSIQAAINRNMLFSDPPDHTRLRALVNQAFTPRRIEALRPQIELASRTLLAKMSGQTEVDLIAQYALPFAVTVISDLLGIPSAERDQVAEWSQSIISPGARGLSSRDRRRRMRLFVDYLHQLFAERQQTPRDDLLTALVQAEEAGEKLSESELSSMVALLLVTGHETTVNLIGNGVLTLLKHEGEIGRILEQPTLIGRTIEELLRYDGPVETSTTRWVRREIVMHGQRLQKGDVVRVVITSADHDPDQFPDPDQFDLMRQNQRHLQFGLGIHYCLGAPLARLEGEIAFLDLFRTYPKLRLAVPIDQLQWRSGVLFRGLETLPLNV